MIAKDAQIENHPVVSQAEWLKARKAHLEKERELTHLRDQLFKERRALPWVKVEKNYVFEGPNGKESLADLFDGRSQLIVYHFMFGPGRKEGCPGCSFISDHLDGANLHLPHHDVTLVAVSRAPWQEFQEFKKRMGWKFKWMSSSGSDFNYDLGVSFTPEQIKNGEADYNYGITDMAEEELHGTSVFFRDPKGNIFHTYSTYARGDDILIGTHNLLDLTPKGRDEKKGAMDWLRHHDKYENSEKKSGCCCD